ncbi:MAG TPA: hypothetical protein VFZ53_07595, partial [Polyangiaceae bacterium]
CMSTEVQAAIETSIAGMEGGDTPLAGDGSGESALPASTDASASIPPTTPTTPAAAPPADPTKPVIPETVAPPEAPKVRRGPIPYDRHESALNAAREEGQKALAAAEARLKSEHEAALGTARQQLELLRIAETDPNRFLDALAQADPRYAQLLNRQSGNGHGSNGHAPRPAPAGEMPGPDTSLADGSPGYTIQGFQAVLDWRDAKIEERIAKQFDPILTEHRTREATQQAVERVKSQVADALTWDGFQENQAEIAKAMREDRRLNLEAAYRRVVIPKLRAQRDTMRGEILAEINGKPKAVTGTTPAGAPPVAASSDDLQSIIRASIANIPRG